jgi:membrane protein implicated in regulation of membrane protease activity
MTDRDEKVPKPNIVMQFFARWQEYITWMPLSVALAILAWIFLGSLDRTAGLDQLPLIISLPIKIAYAFAALGLTYLARRRWRYRLTTDQQKDLWERLLRGDRGPLVVFIADTVLTLCVLFWLIRFFSLPA